MRKMLYSTIVLLLLVCSACTDNKGPATTDDAPSASVSADISETPQPRVTLNHGKSIRTFYP